MQWQSERIYDLRQLVFQIIIKTQCVVKGFIEVIFEGLLQLASYKEFLSLHAVIGMHEWSQCS